MTVDNVDNTYILSDTENNQDQKAPDCPWWSSCSSICIMYLPALWTVPFWNRNGLIHLQASPC